MVAEAARVLLVPGGGRLVITVDKEQAHDPAYVNDSDADERVSAVGSRLGLRREGTAIFSGRSPWGAPDVGDPVFTLAAFERTS